MVKQLRLKQCESTQIELKQHVEAYQLVSTEKQTLGRGRGDHSWDHLSGALAFSFSTTAHPQMTWQALEVAVAMAEFLEKSFQASVDLKWPNDIYRAGLKCGGILLQHQAPHMFIGVGINLLPDSNKTWGSVLPESRQLNDEWAHELPAQFVAYYHSLHPRPIQQIKDEWNKRCAHLGKTVTITDGDVVVKGTFQGLGLHGEALVDGKSVYNGSLRWS